MSHTCKAWRRGCEEQTEESFWVGRTATENPAGISSGLSMLSGDRATPTESQCVTYLSPISA